MFEIKIKVDSIELNGAITTNDYMSSFNLVTKTMGVINEYCKVKDLVSPDFVFKEGDQLQGRDKVGQSIKVNHWGFNGSNFEVRVFDVKSPEMVVTSYYLPDLNTTYLLLASMM